MLPPKEISFNEIVLNFIYFLKDFLNKGVAF
jgi:hypothetical protein